MTFVLTNKKIISATITSFALVDDGHYYVDGNHLNYSRDMKYFNLTSKQLAYDYLLDKECANYYGVISINNHRIHAIAIMNRGKKRKLVKLIVVEYGEVIKEIEQKIKFESMLICENKFIILDGKNLFSLDIDRNGKRINLFKGYNSCFYNDAIIYPRGVIDLCNKYRTAYDYHIRIKLNSYKIIQRGEEVGEISENIGILINNSIHVTNNKDRISLCFNMFSGMTEDLKRDYTKVYILKRKDWNRNLHSYFDKEQRLIIKHLFMLRKRLHIPDGVIDIICRFTIR